MKRFLRFWKRHSQTAQSGAPKARRARLAFEHLETRLALSTLSLDSSGLLTYTAGTGIGNNLTVSLSGSTYSLNDTAENIRVLTGTTAAGSGSNTVTINAGAVNGIVLNLGDRADQVNLRKVADLLTVNAGDGDDLIVVGSTSHWLSDIAAPLTIHGQFGNDTLYLEDYGTSTGRSYTVRNDRVSRDAMADINYDGVGDFILDTSPFADTIDLVSSAGQVYVNANGGNDVVTITAPFTHVFGGAGADTIHGSPYADEIGGESGNDSLYGNAGKDTLTGSDGDDVIYGGEGEDSLSGGSGRDILLGRDLAYEQASERRYEYDQFRDEFNRYQWVSNGTTALDVDQVRPPTCTVMSALATAAWSGIDLAGRIRYLGNYRYEVTLFGGWSAQRIEVTFDGTWTSNDAAPTRERPGGGRPTGAMVNEFWALLYQRAYLTYRGVDWTVPNEDDWGFEPNRTDAMRAISGLNATNTDIGDVTPQLVRDWINQGDPVNGLNNNHRWAILNVFQMGGVWKVTVYNPRALDSLNPDGINDGLEVLNWSSFAGMFTTLCRGVRSNPL